MIIGHLWGGWVWFGVEVQGGSKNQRNLIG
jgi:hypothetical protein